ncbi:hypothetical protein KIH74_35300 [Kineosporia sp. J2-2]|uniref:Uncharacterized protein n=1 Tax=Kineosporia corallincola TaxID=2835133 RepID=A0ABS5TU41_9ACTN|nr:hypothetical protein [Kineosporia corallincola]MBT0774264.1 hypothetical protein [Kineosporia corallincola]
MIHLTRLSDASWLATATADNNEELYETLNFLDDFAILDNPDLQVGYFLINHNEAQTLMQLDVALNQALGHKDRHLWEPVSLAARSAASLMAASP